MDIEKIFRPNKWFVGFCGMLVVVWFFLQMVANARLQDEAKFIAARIFNWNWRGLNCISRAHIIDAKVIKKTDTHAIVEVKGTQQMECSTPGNAAATTENSDCDVTLTFYKRSNNWVLGKVDLQ